MNGGSRFSLQLLVEDFLQTATTDGTLHLESEQVSPLKIFDGGIVVAPRITEGVSGGGPIRIVARAGGVDLERRINRQAFN